MTEMEALAQAIQQLAQEIKSGGGGGGGDSSIFQKLASTAGLASTAMEAFAGIQFGKAIEGFVGALSPSAVQVFDRALNDLAAVAGTALMPVFFTLTGAVKQFSNLMLPVAQELAPVLGALADTVMSILQPAMQQLASVVRMTIPFLQVLADTVSLLAPPLQLMSTVMAAFVQMQADMMFLGANYKDAMSGATMAIQKLANTSLVAVGVFAKFAAMAGFGGGIVYLKNLIKAAEGGQQANAEGLGAATQGRVTDIRSFEKEQMAAAFTATQGGGDPKKTQEQFFKEGIDVLKLLLKEQITAQQAMQDVTKAIQINGNAVIMALAGETFGTDPVGWLKAIGLGLAGVRPPNR